MKFSNNPSALYSKDMLADSLIKLMNTHKYSEITIKQIVENAQLARRTYYRHFDSKEEILQYYILRLIREYEERILEYEQLTFKEFFIVFFNLCIHHKAFLLNLNDNNLLHLLLTECTSTLSQLYVQIADKIIDFPFTPDPQTLDYLITFNTGGALNIAIKWINNGMIHPIDELTNFLTYKN